MSIEFDEFEWYINLCKPYSRQRSSVSTCSLSLPTVPTSCFLFLWINITYFRFHVNEITQYFAKSIWCVYYNTFIYLHYSICCSYCSTFICLHYCAVLAYMWLQDNLCIHSAVIFSFPLLWIKPYDNSNTILHEGIYFYFS